MIAVVLYLFEVKVKQTKYITQNYNTNLVDKYKSLLKYLQSKRMHAW